jgi:hypothetical protein
MPVKVEEGMLQGIRIYNHDICRILGATQKI